MTNVPNLLAAGVVHMHIHVYFPFSCSVPLCGLVLVLVCFICNMWDPIYTAGISAYVYTPHNTHAEAEGQ